MQQNTFDFESMTDPPPAVPVRREKITNQERFDAFIRAHPEMLEAFARVARKARANGHKRYSAKGLLEQIRWSPADAGVDSEGVYKLNNVFSPYFARRLIEIDRSFDGFFETRAVRSR